MDIGQLPPRVAAAVECLISTGHSVEMAADIPGLFYVDYGPELTTKQLINLSMRVSDSGFDRPLNYSGMKGMP